MECYHVNARVSKHLEDIGDLRLGKFVLMLGYCAQAIWCRFRYGVDTFYYVPAPGKSSALYRDWLVMALCRPFFRRLILHWHASGLARWLETRPSVSSRWVTYKLMGGADLNIVLSKYGRADAAKLYPVRIEIVPNGVQDSCGDFETAVLPVRRARLEMRRKAMEAAGSNDPGSSGQTCKVLFLSHCTREKGLFDAVEGVLLANRRLAVLTAGMRFEIKVAGSFVNETEKAEFLQVAHSAEGRSCIEYVGFAEGAEKVRLFCEADVFCFPSYLESFGLVVAEAMCCGLPVVASRAGALPEVLPPGYPCMVNPGDPQGVAEALLKAMLTDNFQQLRQWYKAHFTLERYVEQLSASLRSLESGGETAFADWEHIPEDLKPCA